MNTNIHCLTAKFFFKALIPLMGFALLGCAKGFSVPDNETPKAQVAPAKQNQQCDHVVSILNVTGVDKVKVGLDKIVSEIPQADIDILIMGAKVYRRATPNSKYSETEINDAYNGSVVVLNKVGQALADSHLIDHPLQLSLSEGLIMATTIGYPTLPPEKAKDNISIRDQYDGIPTFGLSAGSSAADAGFAVLGEVNTKIENVNYVARLTYTAVAAKYILETHAYTDDLKTVAFEAASCLSDSRVQTLVKMPRPQANMNECEFGGCKNLPQD